MSIKLMNLVWENAPCRENSLIILLALADWANDEGLCWPSMQKLADKARIDRRSAQRIVRSLKSQRLITIDEGGGRSKQHKYTIETAALCRPPEKGDIEGVETAALGAERATFPTQTATPLSPDPLVEPSKDPSRNRNAEFLSKIREDPLYSHIALDIEIEKMQRWLARPENKGRRLTERFVVNWLNKIDRPVVLPLDPSRTNGNRAAWEAEQRKKMGWPEFS